MIQLAPNECRVLGVLVEKAQTTPQQYPLTLNSLTLGANQKNNRDPVTNLDEDQVLTAVDGLRAKGLVHEVALSGSRVAKYRHVAREVLSISTAELVILTELLLRGPQTLGELRGRASRMHPLESLEVVQELLKAMMSRPEPLVRELPPHPGSRAERYMQLLCQSLHPTDAAPAQTPDAAPAPAASPDRDRIGELEAEISRLKTAVSSIARSLGIDDPLQERS